MPTVSMATTMVIPMTTVMTMITTMPSAHDHGIWTRDHVFLGHGHARAETRAKWAAIVTAIFMVVEIVCGFAYHSMALLADGAHMATHVGALGLAAGAYWLARRHAGSGRFTFGSGKFGDLAAFASAIILGITALAVAVESIQRICHARGRAIWRCAADRLHRAWRQSGQRPDPEGRPSRHGHDHGHGHAHGHDNNMRAAYVHVLADAATSVLAIVALAAAIISAWAFWIPSAAWSAPLSSPPGPMA